MVCIHTNSDVMTVRIYLSDIDFPLRPTTQKVRMIPCTVNVLMMTSFLFVPETLHCVLKTTSTTTALEW